MVKLALLLTGRVTKMEGLAPRWEREFGSWGYWWSCFCFAGLFLSILPFLFIRGERGDSCSAGLQYYSGL